MSEWKKPDEIIIDALRAEVRELLDQCTEQQQERFDHLFPGGVEAQDAGTLRTAIGLCQRTITKNRESVSND